MKDKKLRIVKPTAKKPAAAKKKPAAATKAKSALQPEKKDDPSQVPVLTPAEMAEVARFKALTERRARRRAMIHRLIAKLTETDQLSDAA